MNKVIKIIIIALKIWAISIFAATIMMAIPEILILYLPLWYIYIIAMPVCFVFEIYFIMWAMEKWVLDEN